MYLAEDNLLSERHKGLANITTSNQLNSSRKLIKDPSSLID